MPRRDCNRETRMPFTTERRGVFRCAAPKFAGGLARALQKLYALFQRLDARAPRKLAFPAFLLTLMLVPFLLALLHPAVEAVLMAFPLFGLSCIPQSGAVKRELDSGAYSRDIPAYESLVRETCAALAPAFVAHVCVPLVLMAVGLPLRLSAALGWGFLALSAVSNENDRIACSVCSFALRTRCSAFCCCCAAASPGAAPSASAAGTSNPA